jgi:predicted MFS family arabinose efflux permease
VPFVRARLAIDDGTLGVLLLCPGAGSIVAMPLAGRLIGRLGCRIVIALSASLVCAALPLLAWAPTLWGLAASLLLSGASLGALDVAINVQAVRLEHETGRPLMSGFHGLYSAGGIVGAGCMSGLLGTGFGPLPAVLCVALGLLVLLAASAGSLDSARAAAESARTQHRWPGRPVLAIGLLCAACFLAEGAMVDWSALLLGRADGLSPAWSGLGYAAFSAAMTLGRLRGDALVRRCGARPVLVAGSLVAAAGVLVACLCGSWPVALAGFALTGLGSANLVPLLIGAAGRQGTDPGASVATASTLGYAGILVGPALLGLVARGAGLPVSFVLVACLLASVPAGARFLRRTA